MGYLRPTSVDKVKRYGKESSEEQIGEIKEEKKTPRKKIIHVGE